jgi:hypothetical protein
MLSFLSLSLSVSMTQYGNARQRDDWHLLGWSATARENILLKTTIQNLWIIYFWKFSLMFLDHD